MTASDGVHTPWWGSASLALDQAARWNVGPCTLWLHRTGREWRLAARHADDPMAADSRITLPVDPAEWAAVSDPAVPDAADFSITRFGFRETAAPVDVHLLLGDWPFVVHPSDTWFGPSAREGTLCYAARTTGRLRLENLLQRMLTKPTRPRPPSPAAARHRPPTCDGESTPEDAFAVPEQSAASRAATGALW